MNDANRTRVTLTVAAAVLMLIFVFGYMLPRSRANRDLEARINAIQRSQGEIAALLPQAAAARNFAPAPQPDVQTWIQQNLLTGLERRLVSNNPYRNGQGAELKLRALTPAEVATFMGGLAQTNLIIKRLILQDLGSRGTWEMELFTEIPEAQK